MLGRKNIKKLVCLMGGLAFLLSSCSVPRTQRPVRARKKNQAVVDPYLQEAWLSDIPIILGAMREQKTTDVMQPGQQILYFKTEMSNAEVVQFYRQETERMGWQELAFFEGKTTYLIVEKPYKVALVSIHESKLAKKKMTAIAIYISNKDV